MNGKLRRVDYESSLPLPSVRVDTEIVLSATGFSVVFLPLHHYS